MLSRLTEDESATLPWHRIVASDARMSPNMPPAMARKQRARLQTEGMRMDGNGFIQNPDDHFHYPGPRRSIRWSQKP